MTVLPDARHIQLADVTKIRFKLESQSGQNPAKHFEPKTHKFLTHLSFITVTSQIPSVPPIGDFRNSVDADW